LCICLAGFMNDLQEFSARCRGGMQERARRYSA